MTRVNYRYHSLDDFLIGTPLSVDRLFDDGWGAAVPVKGREVEAALKKAGRYIPLADPQSGQVEGR